MAAPDPLETLRAEGSCSVCLDFLREPVLLECGHNFCRRCVARWWARRPGGAGGAAPCPVCREPSRPRALRPNRQLGNMVEAARRLRGGVGGKRGAGDGGDGPSPRRRPPSPCPGGQPLAPFCHRAPPPLPLDDAAHEYRVRGAGRDRGAAGGGRAGFGGPWGDMGAPGDMGGGVQRV